MLISLRSYSAKEAETSSVVQKVEYGSLSTVYRTVQFSDVVHVTAVMFMMLDHSSVGSVEKFQWSLEYSTVPVPVFHNGY